MSALEAELMEWELRKMAALVWAEMSSFHFTEDQTRWERLHRLHSSIRSAGQLVRDVQAVSP